MDGLGKRVWIFTDGTRPPEGPYIEKGHESIIVLNMNDAPAEIEMTLFFTDKPPLTCKKLKVGPERVRCFRTGNEIDMDGCVPPVGEKYAILLESSVNVVAQYGVLDPSDQPLHLYTVMGYPCEL